MHEARRCVHLGDWERSKLPHHVAYRQLSRTRRCHRQHWKGRTPQAQKVAHRTSSPRGDLDSGLSVLYSKREGSKKDNGASWSRGTAHAGLPLAYDESFWPNYCSKVDMHKSEWFGSRWAWRALSTTLPQNCRRSKGPFSWGGARRVPWLRRRTVLFFRSRNARVGSTVSSLSFKDAGQRLESVCSFGQMSLVEI